MLAGTRNPPLQALIAQLYLTSKIAGGYNNKAGGNAGAVGGGYGNCAGYMSFVGGGQYNNASGTYTSVLGGGSNSATGSYSINIASGNITVVMSLPSRQDPVNFFGGL